MGRMSDWMIGMEEDMAEALILAVEEVQSAETETDSRGDLDEAVSWETMGDAICWD